MATSAVINSLLQDINDVTVEKVSETSKKSWGKSLTNMPTFTIREIELHRQKSNKQHVSITKTFDRGRKFSDERYIFASR